MDGLGCDTDAALGRTLTFLRADGAAGLRNARADRALATRMAPTTTLEASDTIVIFQRTPELSRVETPPPSDRRDGIPPGAKN